MVVSPTQRALAYCRKHGMTAQVVERWNPHARIRQDLFGCIDLVMLDDAGLGVIGVQVTSGSAHAARVKKALEEPRLVAWLRAPARFEVWSFAKRGPAGKRKLWTLRAQAVELDGDALRVVDLEKQPTR